MTGKDFPNENMLAAVKPLQEATSKIDDNRRVADGNESARSSESAQADIERLFEEHHNRVFRAAYRITGSPADAEDVLQTVFLRLARGTEPLTIPENPNGYFARAAINASLDLLRQRKRSKAVSMDDVEERAPISLVSRRNPETSHEDRELRNLIRGAVAKLGPTAGQMFALRYFEGYDNGEIAGLMNTSALVVGVTLHRARGRLRKEIGQYLRYKD